MDGGTDGPSWPYGNVSQSRKSVYLVTKSEPQLFWQENPSAFDSAPVNRPNLVACDRRFSNHILMMMMMIHSLASPRPEEVNLRGLSFPPQGRTRGLLSYGVIRGQAYTVLWDGGGMKNVNS